MTEKQIEAWLGRQLKALGCLYYKFVSPGNTGVPDRIIVLPGGRVIFVELKTDGGQLSPRQEYQLARLDKQGALAFVVRSMEHAEVVVEFVRRTIARRHR